MVDREPTGGYVVATGDATLRWAVDEMVATLGSDKLGQLSVRAGEHLAAILTTAFLGCSPIQVDATGGVDLLFDFSVSQHAVGRGTLLSHAQAAAFEVKSIPGPFREFDAGIDRDGDRGIDTTGRQVKVRIRAANEILAEARPWLKRAAEQLARKVTANIPRNVFLVIHPFDYLAIECINYPIIGRFLDPLPDVSGVDSVWVLWAPDHLTVWSKQRREWIDLLIGESPERDNQNETSQLDILQRTEQYFLAQAGHSGGSPYLFAIRS